MDATPFNARDDLSALAWVHAELRRSLEAAHKALRRHLRELQSLDESDVGALDPAVLRGARVQLHQGAGALELVGQPAAARLLTAAEAALQKLSARPAQVDAKVVDVLERTSFAVLDYLGRYLAGKPVSPVALFPQYRAAAQLAGIEPIHPADLWEGGEGWHALPAEPGVAARQPDDASRGEMEALVLALMRQPDASVQRAMSELCAALGAGAEGALATLWRLAAAFFEAQAAGLLPADVYGKRIASRLLGQMRAVMKGQTELSDRLLHDLQFFAAHARTPASADEAPRLDAVRRAWGIDGRDAVDYETPRLGRVDPALVAQARKRIAAAKDAWSDVAGGEEHRRAGLHEQFALVEESVQRLFPGGEHLAAALHAAVADSVASSEEGLPPALAMEVATALLYVDASVEDGDFDHPAMGERVEHLARRIDDVRAGSDPGPVEAWMEELYRRVSDRQTMGSVVHELRASLSEVEKQIDQYFRDPSQRQLLIPVPAQLSAMRGVFSVLGVGAASQAVVHMRDDVDALAQTEVDPQQAIRQGTFDRLADNLGALGFLIDMLGVQPQMAKSLFVFDAENGRLAALMGRTERPSAFSHFDELEPEPEMPATRAVEVEAVTPASIVPAAPAPAPGPATPATGLEDDAEMREIFVEEAREVVQAARDALARLDDVPDDIGELTAVRRAFHTLKGSSRMIGLRDYGEAAWACEQLYNARLAVGAPMDDALRGFTAQALDYLAGWTEAVASGRDEGHAFTDVARAADALRTEGTALPVLPPAGLAPAVAPPAAAQASAELMARVPDLPSAADLDLPTLPATPVPDAEAAPATAQEPAQEATAGLDFELDLGAFDAPSTAAPAGPALPDLSFPESERAGAAAVASLGLPPLDLADAVGLSSADGAQAIAAPVPPAADEPFLLPALELEGAAAAAPADENPSATAADEAPGALAAGEAPESLAAGEAIELDFGELAAAFAAPGDATVPPAESAFEGAETVEPAAAPLPEPEPVGLLPEVLPVDEGPAEVEPQPAAEPLALPESLEPAPPLPDVVEEAGSAAAEPASQAEPAWHDELIEPAPEPEPEPGFAQPQAAEPTAEVLAEAVEPVPEPADEQFKVIGPLRIGIPLFNIYLNEADELSRRLITELSEWSHEWEHRPVAESTIALAHSLAGSSATVGYADLSALARSLEHAMLRSQRARRGRPGEAELFSEVAEEIRRLLHQFAAGFLRPVAPALTEGLMEHEWLPSEVPETESGSLFADEPELAPVAAEASGEDLPVALEPADLAAAQANEPPDLSPTLAPPSFAPLPEPVLPLAQATFAAEDAFDDDEDIDAVDAIDAELFPIFEEESLELLPQLQARVREWSQRPADLGAASACMRTLHTFKGGARLAGAMRLGEMAHRLETAIEHLVRRESITAADVEPLLGRVDSMTAAWEALRRSPAASVPAAPPEPLPTPVADATAAEAALVSDDPATARPELPAPRMAAEMADSGSAAAIDWSRFATGAVTPAPVAAPAERAAAAGAAVRVRASLLDRLVNAAGEVSITRSRIDAEMRQLQGSLTELAESLDRLRRQLRDIEVQAESQISSRMEAARAAAQTFDPLEMDRFTRFQELTRFMAESVNDVATLQRGLQRTLQSTEDQLAAQARLTRELQDDLLRTRMVEFESLAERLYKVVRQAAKDAGKQVRLDIAGGAIEVDRGVLDRMVGPFEHLLRNCVAHGIEPPELREGAGKDRTGSITVTVTQEGNEVGVEVRDDGAGLDLERIRQRGVERGLLAADAEPGEAELAALIFQPGFSTASAVTELAGRGVGLDVVLAEVHAMGGRIETASTPGRGSSFRLVLPLTTAVTQVVMLTAGESSVAVPSTLIEVVRRVDAAEVEAAYAGGGFAFGDQRLPFFWLPALLEGPLRGPAAASGTHAVVIVRSASQRVALHVDDVSANQEVVVKNLGPQLARLPALAGVTLLATGAVALIYNPVALAAVYGDEVRERIRAGGGADAAAAVRSGAADARPLVLVVDDSLTVRRVTQRLLTREGYRVALAKDGLDALERLAEERPVVMLSDIEMPRMDGFDLVRNVRADTRLAGMPVIMITSRIAQKHRDYARELGVDHYLGKPYAEDELVALVARYARSEAPA